jgi:hypothetical protein
MRRRIGLLFALGSVAGVALAVPSGAFGATTLGETFVPDSCGTDTYIQTADPGNHYMVPFDGVITQWSYQSDSTPPGGIRFKVGRTSPGADLSLNTDITIVGQSATETLAPSALNTYGTQIPVKAGDRIGEFIPDDCSRQDSLYTDHYFDADVQPGVTELFTVEDFQQDISAVVEPDCDKDGLGDETQDADLSTCPQPAAPVQPVVKKKKCKKHKKKHSASSAKKKKCKKHKKKKH